MRASAQRQDAVAGIGRLAIVADDASYPAFPRGKLSRCPPCFRPLAHPGQGSDFLKEVRR